jgi:hypothetical protein
VLAECDANGTGAVGKQDVCGHDLLSLLIKSNIASDMPEGMRMSDSEILSRKYFTSFLTLSLGSGHGINIRFRGTHISACRA